MANMAKRIRTGSPSSRRPAGRRGQSLVEVALSLSILILVFSGAVDLGRAFFIRIMLESAISEGANWSTAYPGCLRFGSAFTDSVIPGGDNTCAGTNSVAGRVETETDQLVGTQITSITLTPPTGKTADQITLGDTVVITINYKFTLWTPVMRALFGDTFALAAQTQEIVAGSGLPPAQGGSLTHTQVSVVNSPTSVTQNPLSCNAGQPTISWTAPSPSDTLAVHNPIAGYYVYKVDPSTGVESTGISYAGTSTSPPLASFLTIPYAGGTQLYSVHTYENPPTVLSDSNYVLAACMRVQPDSFTGSCQTTTLPYGGIDFTWTMPTTYFTNEATMAIDSNIAGFKIFRTSDNSWVVNVNNPTLRSWTYAFTSAADVNKTKNYYIYAYDTSGNIIGYDQNGNQYTIPAIPSPPTHTTTTSDVVMSCP